MSLVVIRPFLKDTLKASGYTEWSDAFNAQNIPSTIIDRSFFVTTNEARGVGLNHHDQEIEVSSEVILFFKGYRNPGEAFDSIVESLDELILEVLKPSNRVGQYQDGIKNIVFDGYSIEPLDASNDNAFRVIARFVFLVSMKP